MLIYKKQWLNRVMLVVGFAAFVAGCQSAPQNAIQSAKVQTHSTAAQPFVLKTVSHDGVQDIVWTITEIKQKKALYFQQFPSLKLNAQSRRVTGHTGCNALYGQYQYDFKQGQLNMNVKANFQSCDGALAQEADLVTALNDVARFEIKAKQLWLYDAKGQILLKAKQ